MRLLLDTHILLWAAGQPTKLARSTRKLLDDDQNELWFSAASIWEITIKRGLAKGDFLIEPRQFRRGLLDNSYVELPITSEHAVTVDLLPQIHKDPFDRILIAQALSEGLTLLTADPLVAGYGSPVRKI